MKKIICLALALLMVVCLVACGEEEQTSTDSGKTSQTKVEETVLVDQDDIKITAVNIFDQSLVGPELKLEIENNTDKKLVFQAQDTAVNKYMVTSILSVEVEAGKTAETTMIFSTSALQTCGITTIASIEVAFRVLDATTWQQYLKTEPVVLETDAAEGFNYTFDHQGVTAYAENGVKIIVKEPIGQGDLNLYIHNSNEAAISVETTAFRINGIDADAQFYQELPAGKHVVTQIVIPEEILEENEIAQVTDMELVFLINNADTGEQIAETAIVKLTVE